MKEYPNGLQVKTQELITEVATRDDGRKVYFSASTYGYAYLWVGNFGASYHRGYLEQLGQGNVYEGIKIVGNIALITPDTRWPFTEELELAKELGIKK